MKIFPGKSPKKTERRSGVGGNRETSKVIPFLSLAKSRLLWVFPILLGVGLTVLLYHGHQSILKMKDLAQKREALIQFNQDLNRKNEEMYREISRLKQDPIYLEEVARKEFGLVKPDEIIFFLDEVNTKEAPRNVTASQFNHP